MFQGWMNDQNEDAELAKNHAYLVGSFWNPEAVKQLIGGNNVSKSSDDEFEKSWEMVREANKSDKPNKKRRRRVVNG
jgi:hypothetical protein